MKKFLKFLIVVSMAISNTFFVSKNSKVYASDDVVIIEDDNTGYIGTVELEYSNPTSDKYYITEYDDYSFYLEFVKNSEGEIISAIINNYIYSYDDFLLMIEEQSNQLKNRNRGNSILNYKDKYTSTLNTVNYTEINEEYVDSIRVDHSLHSTNNNARCNSCGEYSPTNPPTTGYRPYATTNYIEHAQIHSIIVELTSAAVSALATYLTKGLIKPARVIMEFFAGVGGGSLVGHYIDVSYGFRQRFHTVCLKACAEERKAFYYDGGVKKWVNSVHEYYFYFVNPY